MASKKIKVGDPVLLYGRRLEVAAVEDTVACVEDPVAARGREAAVKRERELRSRPWKHLKDEGRTEELEKHWAEVEEAARAASEALFRVKLRKDLLDWWDAEGAWVSDGRILSEDQIARWQALFGGKPKPSGQRDAYIFLTQER